MQAAETQHPDSPFAGFGPQPLRYRWLSAEDQRRATTAEVVRLVVDDNRWSQNWPNHVYQRNVVREVLSLLQPGRAVVLTPAGIVTVPLRCRPEQTAEVGQGVADLREQLADLAWGATGEVLLGVDGCVEGVEAVVAGVTEALAAAGKATAHNELQEALKDISRRPHADATGAVQHSMAPLECVAKDVTGEPKATLGDILSRHATVVPRPLDQAVHKVWGFASDRARHVREGQPLDRPEAQLVVGLAAALANYLLQKARPGSDGRAL
jgi:hypothetical protein